MQHLFTPLKEKAQAGCLPARIHRRTKMRLLQTALLTAIMTFCLNMSFAQTYYQVYHSGDGSAAVVNGVTVGYSTSGSVGWGSQCGDMQTRPYCIVGNSGSSWTYTFSPAISSVRLHMVMVASGLIGGSEVAHVLINGAPYTVTNGNISGSTSPNSCGDATVLTTSGGAIINGSTGSIPTGVITINPGTPITSLTINNSGSTASSGFWNFGLFLDGPAPPENITGTPTVCTGSTTTLSDATSGGTWSSSNTSIATVNSTGVVTGVTSGTATISYTNAGGSATQIVTVNAAPGTFSGEFNICLASTFTLSNAVTGGTWASSNTGRVTIGSSSGVATSTGVSLGTVNISYTVNGCLATRILTVSAAGGVTGIGPVCPGGTLSLTSSIPGGVWSVQYPSIGTISSTGLFTGVSAGTTRISYMCGATGYVPPVTVNPIPDAITGTAAVCQGFTTSLSSTTTGGSWSSSATGIATVNSSGVVTGVAAGTAVISYIVGGCSTTLLVTVNSLPTVSAITGNTTLSTAITTALTSSTTGGVWTSSNSTVGTINSSTGVVTGLTSGTSTISYTVTSSGCSTTVTTNVTVKTPNSGLSFDGSNDYISAAAILPSNQSFTKEAWIYLTNSGLDNNIISSSDNAFWVPGGQLRAGLGFASTPAYAIDPAAFTFNQWVHVATTFDAASHTLKLYKNGALVATNTSAFTYNSGTITIGAYSTTSNLLQGKMDEVRIWNVARTQAQIQADMNCDAAQNANLLAYYRFDEGVAGGTNTSRAFVMDYSGNSYCGTLNNFALTGSSSNFVTGTAGSCNTITIPVPGTFSGNVPVCVGSGITLSNSVTGGTWSTTSSNITLNALTGAITGVTSGNAVVKYTVNCSIASVTVTVNAVPTATISYGSSAYCASGTATVTQSGQTGGTYTSTSGLSIDSATGAINLGASTAGTYTVTYSFTNGSCNASTMATVTVNAAPGAITGDASALCQDGTVTLSNSVTGGTWASSASSAASVGTSGVVTALLPGNATISYTLSNGCTSTRLVNINANPSTSINITGSSVFCDGNSAILTPAITGATPFLNAPGAAGATTVCDCPPGYVAVGLSGGAGTWMDRFFIHCRQLTGGVLTGGTVTTASNGASGGGAFQGPYIFSGNKVMVGASAVASWANTFHSITGYGQDVSYIAAGGNNSASPTALTTIAGASGVSTIGSVFAPAGMVITGMYTYDNWFVTGVAFRYKPISAFSTTSTAVSPYIWSTGDTITSITVNTSGSYSVSYTATNGCSSTASQNITVNPLPADITGTSALCAGASTTLENTTTGGVWTSSNTTVATIESTTGVANALSEGTTTITYTLPTGCVKTMTFVVNPVPAITGTHSVCEASATTLSATISGGTWASSNDSVAAIGTTGIVSGLTPGFAVITYTLPTGCTALQEMIVNPLPHAGSITGDSVVAAGSSIALSSSVEGGTWSASNSIATVSSTGVVTGVGAGAVVITYSYTNLCGTDITTKTVNVVPGVGSGSTSICVGANTTLSGLPVGGTWSSNNVTKATVNASGMVVGVSAGTVNISYTVSGITTVTVITVNTTPTNITGSLSICNGGATTLSSSPAGGTWSVAGDTVAAIGTTGILSGLTIGTANVSYTLSNGCAKSAIATVNAVPSAIGGTTSICVSGTTTLTNDVTGGVYSSSNSSVATTSLSGVVTGVAAGTSTISYSIGGCRVTTVISVISAPAITGMASMCIGNGTTLSNATTGGTWTSSNSSIATVNASSGFVMGAAAGTATITYTLPTGCTRTQVVTVNSSAIAAGPPMICIGAAINYSSSPATTSWTSSTPSVATVNSSGLVTGVSSGTTTLYMVTAAGCNSSTVIAVNPQPTITGTLSMCLNGTTSLTGSASGVTTWTSSSSGTASVGYLTGVVTGMNVGTSTISYTVGVGQGCLRTAVVTVNALPTITGTPTMCVGNSVALAGSPAGGSWSSATPAIGTVSTTGMVTGVTAGTVDIIYTNATTGCAKTKVATINATPGAFIGTTTFCVGTSSTLTNPVAGGTWSSSNASIASAGLTTGVITGVAAGTALISYRIGTCQASSVVTIKSLPNNITGGMQTVVGATTTLNNSTTGGTWSSSNPTAGTISSTGVVTGIAAGTSNIVYTGSNGCTKSTIVTINAAPALPGPRSVCVGSTINISSPTVSVSSWSSSDTSKATVSGGIITGVAPGTSTITYVLTAGGYSTTEVTVLALPAAITGSLGACVGATTTLSNATTGGAWLTSNSGLATIDTNGVVTGVGAGPVTITYSLGTGCRRTVNVTVSTAPAAITGSADVCAGTTMYPYLASPSSGTWSSSDITVATVPSTHGAVTGVAAGTALISLTNAAGCSTTKVVNVSVCRMLPSTTAVSNLNDNLNITLYPNPTKGTFSVNTPEAGTLSVSTIDGREVMKREVNAGTTELKLPATITTGIYMCRFYGNDGASTTVRLVFEAE